MHHHFNRNAMTTIIRRRPPSRNAPTEPKQQPAESPKTFARSPYREATRVVRVPESLVPKIKEMLEEAKQDVADSAWLDSAKVKPSSTKQLLRQSTSVLR